ELVKVVALVLTLRKLVEIDSTHLEAADATTVDRVDSPIEKAILKACASRSIPSVVATSPAVIAAGSSYEQGLRSQRLLADDEVRAARRGPVAMVAVLLLGLALAKIIVALATGHSNIALLIILMFIAIALILKRIGKRLTAAGESALRDLRSL